MLLPGPGMVFLPALPKVYGAGVVKAAVLKKWFAVRWSRGSATLWPGTMLGRFGVPELAKSSAKKYGSSGVPSCRVTVPLSDHWRSSGPAMRESGSR